MPHNASRAQPPRRPHRLTGFRVGLAFLAGLAALAVLSVAGFTAAAASDRPASAPAKAPATSPRTATVDGATLHAQECSACHIAYSPRLLPAESWRRMTGQLDRHYGTDASLDPASVAALASWLEAGAARNGRASVAPPDDRITRSSWFIREHRDFDAAAWAHPSVRSASQCIACHSRAAEGDFRERGLRFPAGLPERYRRAFDD